VTKSIGLIGKPLGHSISPVFQQAALDRCHIDARYELWETKTEALAQRVESLRQPERLGANVTVPHKEAVIPLLDELDPQATYIGAVNTIVNRHGRLCGYNTDGTGFACALREEGGFDARSAHVVQIGAGGAGRAAAAALVQAGAASITVFDIDRERAQRLVRDLGGQGKTLLKEAAVDEENLAAAVSKCQLLVNCTPIGMRHSPQEQDLPLPAHLIPAEALVFDVVANPLETRFMAEARKRGARALGGLSMLVHQGAHSFELWTGVEAPVDVMFAAARTAMSLSAEG
jgi:shikimate dehydrogenase